MVQIRVKELFAPEIAAGIKQFTGGRDTYDYESLSPEEEDSVKLAFDRTMMKIRKISPNLSASLIVQRDAFVKWAGVAKGTFPDTKDYSYPSTSGGLGADWITPELYKYDTTPSSTYPCYTDYNATASTTNTFDLTLTNGTARYIAGNSTESNSYKGSPVTNKHSFVVIAQDGLIEIGTTPKCNMLLFKTDAQSKYSPISMNPALTQTLEEYRSIYQYNTPGMIPMDHNVGTIIKAHPNVSGTSTIVPFGMVFYEYDFAKTLPRSTTTP